MSSSRRSRKRKAEGIEAADIHAERFVVDSNGPLIAYEHVHRYVVAAEVFSGTLVLDLASGSGYGTSLLRAAGIEVVSLDLDLSAVRSSTPSVCADGERLPFGDESFGGVICFEAIEHLGNPSNMLAEVHRVLRRGGAALFSTPDRVLYTELMGNQNPYHISELNQDEFRNLLTNHFKHVCLYGQSVWAGSWMANLDCQSPPSNACKRVVRIQTHHVARDETGERAPWIAPDAVTLPAPLYLVALCAKQKRAVTRASVRIGKDCLLHDNAQWLLGSYLTALDSLVVRDSDVASHATHARNLEDRIGERDLRITNLEEHSRSLEEEFERVKLQIAPIKEHTSDLENLLAKSGERVAGLEEHSENLEAELEIRAERITSIEADRANLQQELATHTDRIASVTEHSENLEAELEIRAERITSIEAHSQNLERLLADELRIRRDLDATSVKNESDLEGRLNRSVESLRTACQRLKESEARLVRIQNTRIYRVFSRLGHFGSEE